MMHSEIREGCLYVSGEVSVRTLDKAAYACFAAQCGQPETHSADFGGVEKADSACIALLMAALRTKGSLKLQSLPPSVRTLAELYEVEPWLEN